MFRTLLRVLFWTLLIAVFIAGVAFLLLKTDLPRTQIFTGLAVLAALILGIILLRRFLARRHRRSQIEKIVTLDPRALDDAPKELRLLKTRWARAAAILRTSYLGHFRDPVYALPWYMVMGKTGAGKSSAITHSGLNAMLTDVGPDPDHAQTRNCDWFFFRDSVVLDTSGRYMAATDEAADSAEWREFLLQLSRYRRKESLNGLVIAVAADSLHGDGAHLLADARCLRRRIDEIMRSLGAKFPVYLLVTKIDLPAGVAQVLENLPAELKKQSMGAILQSPDKQEMIPVAAQIKKALGLISDNFRSLCLFSRTEMPMPHGILAWEEIKSLMPALNTFAGELFTENPYQETPLLRGIFFSSALRSGAERQSRAFLKLDALVRRLLNIGESSGGVFLHDFFSRILPGDRNLNVPIAEYLRWRSSMRILAYAFMLLVTFSASALLFLSFERNTTLLHAMSRPTLPQWDGDIPSRILAFERRFREATRLEHEVGNSELPSMGFNQSREAMRWFNSKLNEQFSGDILTQSSRILEHKRAEAAPDTPDQEFQLLVADLVWRFDLLDATKKGKSFDELLQIPAMPQGVLWALNVGDIPLLVPSMAYSVARYYHGITTPAVQEQNMRSMRASLSNLPEIKGASLHWLTHRAGKLALLAPLRGGIFGDGAMSHTLNQVQLDPVYTAEGFAITMDYLDRLAMIVAGSSMTPYKQAFFRWYAAGYLEAWKSFAFDFAQKMQEVAAASTGSTSAMEQMSSENNPFFQLLLRMDDELRPVRSWIDPVPPWVRELGLMADALRTQKIEENQQRPLLDKRLTDITSQLSQVFNETVDSEAREQHARARQVVKDMQVYLSSLRDLTRHLLDEDLAFNVVKSAMPSEDNKEAASSPLALAKTALMTFQHSVEVPQDGQSPVFALNNGPFAFFMTRLMNAASCHIQALWEGKVLARAGAVAPLQLQQTLFAEQGGLARDFVDKTLPFFFNNTLNGFEIQKLYGTPIPFTNDFLQFLNAGIFEYHPMPQQSGVTMSVMPVDVNAEALEKPFAVTLSLDCARQKQELTNYNSPASLQFDWQKGNCGDTTLTIRFNSTTVQALYEGENGFVRFLHDFRFGSKTFTPADFPSQEAILKKLGVSEITVRYKITNAEAVLRAVNYAPGALPFVAAQCRR